MARTIRPAAKRLKQIFLDTLAETGNVTTAAKVIDVKRANLYR